MKIGAQLYTAHDLTKTLEGFSETLKRVADIGYTTVQVSGTCAYEPEWLAEELKKNGLTCGITHTPFDRMVSDTDKVIAEHTTFGRGRYLRRTSAKRCLLRIRRRVPCVGRRGSVHR